MFVVKHEYWTVVYTYQSQKSGHLHSLPDESWGRGDPPEQPKLRRTFVMNEFMGSYFSFYIHSYSEPKII